MNELFAAVAPPAGHRETVLHTHAAAQTAGQCRIDPDTSAADGSSERQPDLRAPKVTADRNSYQNDSVYVQFSQVTATGTPIYRTGTPAG